MTGATMDITPVIPKGRQVITSYGGGSFKVSGQVYQGSVIIFPERTVSWTMTVKTPITLDRLTPVLQATEVVELLLIGCAPHQKALPPKIRDGLKQKGIRMEVMDTGAACRTFNVLLAEERRVAAALIALE